jgi:folylpolyglutamate synthase/dihydropteroate synthase
VMGVVDGLVGEDGEMFVSEGEGGLERALEWAAKDGGEGLIVVCGSLYLVADLFRLGKKIL